MTCTQSGMVEVYTARKERHYSFTAEGKLISDVPSDDSGTGPSYSSLSREGSSMAVPTSPLLWIFSNLALCWGMAAAGGAALAIAKRIKR